MIRNKYNKIKTYFWLGLSLSLFTILDKYLEKFKFYNYYKENKFKFFDAFSIGALFLIFFKLIFSLLYMHYAPIYINVLLYGFCTFIAYKFELMIKLKTFIVYNYYNNRLVIDPYFLGGFAYINRMHYYNPMDNFRAISGKNNLKFFYHFQKFFNQFHIFLFWLRLWILAEPYLFFILRFLLVTLLIINKWFIFAALISIIGIFSRILFYMTALDNKDLIYLYRFLHYEPMHVLNTNEYNTILIPERYNAELLYIFSLIGVSIIEYNEDITWKELLKYKIRLKEEDITKEAGIEWKNILKSITKNNNE